MKLISIVIPTYNCGIFLRETIKSLQSQTYTNWEAICVDDGSTDNTIEIAREIQKEDERVRIYIREEIPKGGSHCRNIGLQHAKGEYVIFLDGDDILIPTCLENRLRKIENTKFDFAVFSMGTFQNGVIGKVITDSKIKDHLAAFASNHAVWQVTSPIYKKSFLIKLGGFDINFQRMQDLELGLRAIAIAKNNYVSYIDDKRPDCFYRISDSVVTSKKYIIGLQQFDKFVCLLHKLEDEGVFDNKRKLSHIYLCLALSSYIIYLRKGVYDKISMNEVYKTYSIKEKMQIIEKLIFYTIFLFSFCKNIQFKYVRVLRRLLMILYFN